MEHIVTGDTCKETKKWIPIFQKIGQTNYDNGVEKISIQYQLNGAKRKYV